MTSQNWKKFKNSSTRTQTKTYEIDKNTTWNMSMHILIVIRLPFFTSQLSNMLSQKTTKTKTKNETTSFPRSSYTSLIISTKKIIFEQVVHSGRTHRRDSTKLTCLEHQFWMLRVEEDWWKQGNLGSCCAADRTFTTFFIMFLFYNSAKFSWCFCFFFH